MRNSFKKAAGKKRKKGEKNQWLQAGAIPPEAIVMYAYNVLLSI
jgi:hypothetical protein